MKTLNKKITIIISILLAFLVTIIGVAVLSGNKSGQTASGNALDIATGKRLYQQNCASCHGVDLKGQKNWRKANADGSFPAPPHNEEGHTWHHNDEVLFNYTKLGGKGIADLMGYKNPNSRMPAYKDRLSDEEVWAILGYIKSTWPHKIRDIQAKKNAK